MLDFFTKNWNEGGLAHRVFLTTFISCIFLIAAFVFTLICFVWAHGVPAMAFGFGKLMITEVILFVPAVITMIATAVAIDDNSDWKN